MHIMHVIDGLPLGGAERMLVDISNATLRAGHQVSACVTRSCVDLAGQLDARIRLHVLGRTQRFELRPLLWFAGMVRREGVDLVQAHSRSTFSLLALLKGMGVLRVPVVLQDHFGSIETNTQVPTWFRIAGKLCLAHYVGVSDKLGVWARSAGIAADRIQVLGNALDLSRLTPAAAVDPRQVFGLPATARVGVVVAGIRPDKGIHVLLEALAARALPADVRFVIIGHAADPAYARRCEQRSQELGLGSVVTFVGPRMDVPALIAGAQFAVLPSVTESGPLVLIEYLMAGLPFVASRVGDIGQRVAQSGLAEFVGPGDAPAMRGALDRLWALSPAAMKERGQAGIGVAQREFDIQSVLPRWLEIYRRVLGK